MQSTHTVQVPISCQRNNFSSVTIYRLIFSSVTIDRLIFRNVHFHFYLQFLPLRIFYLILFCQQGYKLHLRTQVERVPDAAGEKVYGMESHSIRSKHRTPSVKKKLVTKWPLITVARTVEFRFLTINIFHKHYKSENGETDSTVSKVFALHEAILNPSTISTLEHCQVWPLSTEPEINTEHS